jgi:hypothetical protein
MPTKNEPPTEDELQEHIEESEDDRVAAEEAGDVANEDAAAARDARSGRVPSE